MDLIEALWKKGFNKRKMGEERILLRASSSSLCEKVCGYSQERPSPSIHKRDLTREKGRRDNTIQSLTF